LLLVNAICTILLSSMKQLIIIPICLTLIACDGGLAPPPPKPPVELGFSGTIYYAPGSWPPVDSLVNLMIFRSTNNFPLSANRSVAFIF
jgi:hypothetical protein